ncbi:MAG TPA: acyl carrier protein [Planctomycetota bacterium]|nr:acyl carrier protein [Planctomycetota bacterium]
MSGTLGAVQRLVRETLAAPDELDAGPTRLLFYDLAFTSMDLVDLLFRIEDEFGFRDTERTLQRAAQGALADEEFAQDGVLTPRGREQLQRLLHDAPPAIFPESIHVSTLARFCTVGAVARLVDAGLRERG